jgi:serine/threonine-protein kinase
MVTPEGQVKVLDFGLGKSLEAERSSGGSSAPSANSPTMTTAATQAGIILGTAGYMSPEQAKGRPTDRRSDVWAFGCVLYEMLTGAKAFEGEDIAETLAAIVRGEPDWARLPSDLSPSVRMLLTRCLIKDRAERVADMSVVRFLLSDVGASLSGPAVAAKTGVPAAVKSRVVPVALATAAAVALVTFGLTRALVSPRAALAARSAHVSIALPEGYELGSTQLRPLAISHDGTRIAYVGE